MKNLNTKAHIHARELLKFAENQEWMQFVLHTDTMGGFHLLNCWEERGNYNKVPGLYVMQVQIKNEWHTLYVGESHGNQYETGITPHPSNQSSLLSTRFNRFCKTLVNRVGGKDGLHTAGKFLLKHKLAHFSYEGENRILLKNVRLAVFPNIDLDKLDRMVDGYEYPRCKDGTYDIRSLGTCLEKYRTKVPRKRKELYQELEQAFIDELQPLCNKQGDTNYCAANGLFVISEGLWSEDRLSQNKANTQPVISKYVETQKKKRNIQEKLNANLYADLPANVCVEGEWINLSTVIR